MRAWKEYENLQNRKDYENHIEGAGLRDVKKKKKRMRRRITWEKACWSPLALKAL